MKTYTYQKPELNLTITITPPAWAWAQRRFSTPEVYAEHQAAQFLAGRPVDRDVVIELISKPCETESDGGGVAAAQAQPPVTVQPVINAAPVVESAAVWPRYYFNQQRGDASPCEVVAFTEDDGDCWYNRDGTSGRQAFCYNESGDYLHRCTPAEAATWLRANGHASVADEIEAAEMYEPVGTAIHEGDVVENQQPVRLDAHRELEARVVALESAQRYPVRARTGAERYLGGGVMHYDLDMTSRQRLDAGTFVTVDNDGFVVPCVGTGDKCIGVVVPLPNPPAGE